MKEHDVRLALHSHLKSTIPGILGNERALLIDELGVLEGSFRVDVAVLGREFHGFEIKSPKDNLNRLSNQQESYNLVFDRMTLVCADKYVPDAVKLVPSWWGLMSISRESSDGAPVLNEIWPARSNPDVDSFAMCQLLWREEALAVLKEHGLDYGFSKKSRKAMWKVLAKELEKNEIKDAIRDKLANRVDWR